MQCNAMQCNAMQCNAMQWEELSWGLGLGMQKQEELWCTGGSSQMYSKLLSITIFIITFITFIIIIFIILFIIISLPFVGGLKLDRWVGGKYISWHRSPSCKRRMRMGCSDSSSHIKINLRSFVQIFDMSHFVREPNWNTGNAFCNNG